MAVFSPLQFAVGRFSFDMMVGVLYSEQETERHTPPVLAVISYSEGIIQSASLPLLSYKVGNDEDMLVYPIFRDTVCVSPQLLSKWRRSPMG